MLEKKLPVWLLAAAAACLVGCASPGVPKPPSLHLPEKATNLTAARVGAEVKLTFVVPANTTDGEAIRGVSTAVVCRTTGRGAPCMPVRQLAVTPGKQETEDALPGTLRVGADSVLEYRVELKNDRGRSAGVSDAVFAAGGRAPETPMGVAARSRREGVLVTWQAENGGAPGSVMELRRAGLGQTPPANVSNKGAARFAGKKADEGVTVLVAEGEGEPDGMVDRSARTGESYTYVAQRVRAVRLGKQALELRSAPSAPVTTTYRNTFPPQAPAGLVSVPGGGFGAAMSVDLSWEPNAESDLVGYRVYRSVDGGKSELLTPTPGPAYRDLAVAAGHVYAYRVAAVDAQGNESATGGEVRERLR